MTQQQKIAAALARAGTSHSTPLVHESASVAVEALEPDPSEQETAAVQEVHFAQLKPTPKFAIISHLLICCGLALILVSCYLLVTFHSARTEGTRAHVRPCTTVLTSPPLLGNEAALPL